MIIRHNEIRDLTSDLLSTVCRDVEVEPTLQPITGETFIRKSAIQDDGARLDVSARGFWTRGRKTFVDVKVFNPISKTSMNKQLKAVYKANEAMKKRCYNERILQLEHGTFTPLVFFVLGGVGFEGNRFLKRLNELIADKMNEHISVVTNFTRTRYCFALLRSTLLCIRGSRSHKVRSLEDTDFKLAVSEARL